MLRPRHQPSQSSPGLGLLVPLSSLLGPLFFPTTKPADQQWPWPPDRLCLLTSPCAHSPPPVPTHVPPCPLTSSRPRSSLIFRPRSPTPVPTHLPCLTHLLPSPLTSSCPQGPPPQPVDHLWPLASSMLPFCRLARPPQPSGPHFLPVSCRLPRTNPYNPEVLLGGLLTLGGCCPRGPCTRMSSSSPS